MDGMDGLSGDAAAALTVLEGVSADDAAALLPHLRDVLERLIGRAARDAQPRASRQRSVYIENLGTPLQIGERAIIPREEGCTHSFIFELGHFTALTPNFSADCPRSQA